MKRHGWSWTVAVLIAALVWATFPATSVYAESGDDSTGAAVAIGLMVAVVVVYGLVSLRSDVERYTEADLNEAITHAAQVAESSPLVIETITVPIGLQSHGTGMKTEVAGAGLGWRMSF
jgi:hypothetical protein